jgi:hypothetical protein
MSNDKIGTVCVLNSSDLQRKDLVEQIRLIGQVDNIIQFKSIAECVSSQILANLRLGLKYLFLEFEPDSTVSAEFITNCRKTNPQLSIILTTNTITLTDLRILFQSGVSQILIRPFNVQQILTKIYMAEQFTRRLLQEHEEMPINSKFDALLDQITPEVYMVNIHGWLTDHCNLPQINNKKDASVFIDCTSLFGMNSIGIRLWMLWIKELKSKNISKLELEGLRPQILKQASLVKGFIPDDGNINSFYLDYYCEELNVGRQFRFRKDYDFNSEKMILPHVIEYNKSGKKYYFMIEDQFRKTLKFYKGQIEVKEVIRKES